MPARGNVISSAHVATHGLSLLVFLFALTVTLQSSNAQNSGHFVNEFEIQWGLSAIRAQGAYERLRRAAKPTAGEGVRVAIAGSGIDFSHPELAPGWAPGPKGDFDGSRATAMAGILAARNDGVGMKGLAHKTRLVSASKSPKHLAKLPAYGVKVLAIDRSGRKSRRKERYAFRKLAESDIVVAASLGGQARGVRGLPARYAAHRFMNGQMLIVGAMNEHEKPISRSCAGSFRRPLKTARFCLFAPGADVWSVVAKGHLDEYAKRRRDQLGGRDYALNDGPAAAVPFVAGAAAILRAARPDLSAKDIVQYLLRTARPKHARNENRNYMSPTYGWGILDLDAAVQAVLANRLPPPRKMFRRSYRPKHARTARRGRAQRKRSFRTAVNRCCSPKQHRAIRSASTKEPAWIRRLGWN